MGLGRARLCDRRRVHDPPGNRASSPAVIHALPLSPLTTNVADVRREDQIPIPSIVDLGSTRLIRWMPASPLTDRALAGRLDRREAERGHAASQHGPVSHPG